MRYVLSEHIYRQVIGVHGFCDSRGLPETTKVNSQNLWRKGEAVTQKARREGFASLRAAREERSTNKRFTADEEILHKTRRLQVENARRVWGFQCPPRRELSY